MNVVALVGNVASVPEMHQTKNDKQYCTFRIAVSRRGSEQADFLTVVAWERQAEICTQYIELGQRVGVEGRLHHTTWRTEDNKPRSRVEVVASRVELMNKSNRDRNEPEHVHPLDRAEPADAALSHDGEIDDHENVFSSSSLDGNSVFEREPMPV